MGVLSHFKEGRGVEMTVLTKNDSAIDSVRMVCFGLFWLFFFFFPHAFSFLSNVNIATRMP